MPPRRKYVRKDPTRSPGKPSKSKKCNIKGCDKPAVRSLSRQQNEEYLLDAGLELESNRDRRIKPCAEHYKLIKKRKKKDDKIKRLRFDARTSGGKGLRY